MTENGNPQTLTCTRYFLLWGMGSQSIATLLSLKCCKKDMGSPTLLLRRRCSCDTQSSTHDR
eukprot:3283659-Amphidinium_carterae.1